MLLSLSSAFCRNQSSQSQCRPRRRSDIDEAYLRESVTQLILSQQRDSENNARGGSPVKQRIVGNGGRAWLKTLHPGVVLGFSGEHEAPTLVDNQSIQVGDKDNLRALDQSPASDVDTRSSSGKHGENMYDSRGSTTTMGRDTDCNVSDRATSAPHNGDPQHAHSPNSEQTEHRDDTDHHHKTHEHTSTPRISALPSLTHTHTPTYPHSTTITADPHFTNIVRSSKRSSRLSPSVYPPSVYSPSVYSSSVYPHWHPNQLMTNSEKLLDIAIYEVAEEICEPRCRRFRARWWSSRLWEV